MAFAVDISIASENDFPTLAHIASRAMEVDLIHRIIYPSSDRFDTTLPDQFVAAELRRAALDSQAHIFKATATNSDQIVGYALLRFSDGKRTSGPSMASFPPGCNRDFIELLGREFGDKHKKHMGGKEQVSKWVFPRLHVLCGEGAAEIERCLIIMA